MRYPVLLSAIWWVSCSVGVADPALVTAILDTPDPTLSDDGGAVSAGGASDGGGALGVTDAGGGPMPDSGVLADGGVDPCLSISCSATGARCDSALARCVCGPGFTGDGTSCTMVMPGTPETRTEGEVCTAWREVQTRREAGDGFTASTATCDRGQVSRNAVDDALARLNFFRWLTGLGPTAEDTQASATAQSCALVSAWNPAGPQAHYPQSTATCYTADGAAGAGSSNIAWGARDATDAIDLWMIDFGNETTFGHRRWLLNPPLSPVGLGHYRGGNNYGSASCISVFGSGGTGPRPTVSSFPPAGFSPTALTQWHWTIHGNIPLGNPSATVVRMSDGANLPVRLEVLNGSYGQAAVALFRDGWNPEAGDTYHVTLSGTGGVGVVEYDVKPTDCP